MEVSGTAKDSTGSKGCIWDIRCGRIAEVGTFSQVHVKMSKYVKDEKVG